jgi:hypothetical protein
MSRRLAGSTVPRRRALVRRQAPLAARLALKRQLANYAGHRGQQQIPPVRGAPPRLSDDGGDQAMITLVVARAATA